MSRRRSLSDEERALWSGVARSIKPLRHPRPLAESSDAVGTATVDEKPVPSAPAAAIVNRQAPVAKAAPPLAPLGRRLKQRVARGREPIEARLDLHGHTQSEAHAALLLFLRRAQADGVKTVLVVTGKGGTKNARDESAGRGVLKRAVPLWLALPEFRRFVVGFEDAHVGHGGQGALYVRLRRGR
jgi:DNA-nicking Smr family endonuclease